jgi:hypothetical protein
MIDADDELDAAELRLLDAATLSFVCALDELFGSRGPEAFACQCARQLALGLADSIEGEAVRRVADAWLDRVARERGADGKWRLQWVPCA